MLIPPRPPVGYVLLDDKDNPWIWAGSVWLKADGRLVSRKEYPDLYKLIGTSYTDEDERCCTSELFALPDHTRKEDNGRQVPKV